MAKQSMKKRLKRIWLETYGELLLYLVSHFMVDDDLASVTYFILESLYFKLIMY